MPIASERVATSLSPSSNDAPIEAGPGLPLEAPSVNIVNLFVMKIPRLNF